MNDYHENPTDDTDVEVQIDDQGDNPAEDLNAVVKDEIESMDDFDEDSDASDMVPDGQGTVEQSKETDGSSYDEDVELDGQDEMELENLSDDELKKRYEDVRKHDSALGEAYVKYDEQIGQISSDKPYYSENEWNSRIDEKIDAQNDVSIRRNQIQSEMRKLEKEIDRRKVKE